MAIPNSRREHASAIALSATILFFAASAVPAIAVARSADVLTQPPHAKSEDAASLNAQLLRAAQEDEFKEVSLLLRKHASANVAQGDGTTPLHWAAYNDDAALTRELLRYGANPNTRTRLRNLTPLHMAAESGDGAVIQLLLRAGAQVDAVNESGTTPLMIASAAGSTDAVEVLLAHGADIHAREKTYGQTALFFAASHDRADAVRLLLSKGADPKVKTSITKLARVTLGVNGEDQEDKKSVEAAAAPSASSAAAKESKPAAGLATDKEAGKSTVKPDDKVKDAYGLTAADRKKRVYGTQQIGGLTALLIAARDGKTAAVNALLDAHDDINQTSDTDHATALVLSLINGHYDLAKMLLDRGADPKLATADGITPLYALLDVQWAPHTWYPQPVIANEQTAYIDLAKALLEHGADPNVAIKKKLWFRVFANDETWFELEGATPFLRASLAGDLAAMQLLVDHGADPNRKTASGDTALMASAGIGWAAYWTANAPYPRTDAVKLCLQYGADLNAVDSKGYTALHGAAFRGDNDLVKYLIALGADVHVRTKDGDTVADLANGLFEHAMVHPDTVALLEQLGSSNSHNCRSNECVVPAKEDKPAALAATAPSQAAGAIEATTTLERKSK